MVFKTLCEIPARNDLHYAQKRQKKEKTKQKTSNKPPWADPGVGQYPDWTSLWQHDFSAVFLAVLPSAVCWLPITFHPAFLSGNSASVNPSPTLLLCLLSLYFLFLFLFTSHIISHEKLNSRKSASGCQRAVMFCTANNRM